MKARSRYVFGAAMAGAGVLQLAGLGDKAQGASITAANFTFETSGLALATAVTSPAYGPLIAESGVGSAYGSHAATATAYSSPAGNGSTHSFSSNDWAAGDYYQFNVPTTGLDDLVVSFDQGSSGTGPKVFSLAYSTDGTNFVGYSTYTIFFSVTSTATAGSASTNFGGTLNSGFNKAFDLSTITALNNDALAAFRIVEADTTTATGGTDRVDNVIVAGDTATGVPEPASIALMSMGIAGVLGRRRR